MFLPEDGYAFRPPFGQAQVNWRFIASTVSDALRPGHPVHMGEVAAWPINVMRVTFAAASRVIASVLERLDQANGDDGEA